MGLPNSREIQDAKTNVTGTALAAGSTASTESNSIDLGDNTFQPGTYGLKIEAPALTTSQLPDADTVSYTVQDSADDSSFADLFTVDELTQTGAGGAGASAASQNVRLPGDVRQYIRVQATKSNATPDASGASFDIGLVY